MITIDFETRSRADIRKSGASVYARDESTLVLCLAYSLGGEPFLWKPGNVLPQGLFKLIRDGQLIEAHNVGFERLIWRHVCHERMGWPDVPFAQWRCSLAACCRLTLPRALDAAGSALGLPVQKDEGGKRIMMRLCKPKKPSKKDPSEWDNDPEKLQRLYLYCKQDVRSEMAISAAIPPLTPSELKVWQLDQRINLRGLAIDRPAIENALAIVDQTYKRCCDALSEITKGKVSTPKQVQAMRDFIESAADEPIPNLAKETVSEWLDREELPKVVREVLLIRQEASKASTAKLKAMLERCDTDGRVRGNLVYHGASTGRWAGSGIQIQNYPRGVLSSSEIEIIHRFLPAQDESLLDLLLAPPIDCISSSLRSMVVSEPGHRLMVCDFASIEARVLAWVAGQTDLLTQFAEGADVYVSMASKIYEVEESEVIKTQRHVGKTAILGLGYGMGHRSFRSACKLMAGVLIDNKFARQVVKTYRESNSAIKDFWASIGTACVRAVETHQPHRVGRLEITANAKWMQIRLPSGRQLHYCKPHLVDVVAPWSEGYFGAIIAPEEATEQLEDMGIDLGERQTDRWIECSVPKGGRTLLQKANIRSELQPKEPQYIKQIQFWAVNSKTRKWSKERTYGGKLTENVVQAIARDFLCEAMLRVERERYPIVATVHDEIICEVPDQFGDLRTFERIMKQIPVWGRGCPIEVEGFEAKRYRK
ncbi:DNA polymerase I, thermostable [Stieleria maiorica]|uniref:DNA-directed DNA polymerase n=1 Tax=Stieleria maiorica TaxID=2795974 RepID=A0A5B9MGE5_9BACT|nr:DNA polymerase [Stieleria maiorica]QEF98177.1 DNA polymerase I, thermostable [Stieleria maiorica]